MKAMRLAALGTGFLLLASAQAARSLSAEEWVERNLEARGGGRWDGVVGLKLTGQFNRNGRENRLEIWRVGPDRVRFETRFLDRHEIYVLASDQAWRQTPREGFERVPPEELGWQLELADLYLPWLDLMGRFRSLEVAGQDSVNGRPVVQLKATLPEGPTQDWFVDTESYQVVRTDRSADRPDGQQVKYSTYHFDYREVEGLAFAHYVEIDFGTGMYSLVVESIEVNPAIPDGLFEAPSTAAEPAPEGASNPAGGAQGSRSH